MNRTVTFYRLSNIAVPLMDIVMLKYDSLVALPDLGLNKNDANRIILVEGRKMVKYWCPQMVS